MPSNVHSSCSLNTMKLLLFWMLVNIFPCHSKIVAKEISNQFTCLTILTEAWWSSTSVIISENADLLHNIVHFPVRIFTADHANQFFENIIEKPNSYIIIPNSTSSLELILQDLVESQAFLVSTYMILTPHNVDVQSVAVIMWNFRLPNSIIIQASSTNADLHIYSTHIVDCGAYSEAKHILDLPANSSCPSGRKIPQFSFKQTFIGCPLKVIWIRSVPYVYPVNNTWGWRGIYIDALDALRQLSGRDIVLNPDDTEYYNDVATAFSYDSVIEAMENETQLFMGSGELGLGELLDVSTIIIDEYLKIIAPRPLANYWKNFSSAMNIQMFAIGLIFMLLVVGITYCFNQFGSSEDIVATPLSMTQILLLLFSNFVGTGGYGKLSPNSSLRLLVGILILCLLVINMFLQGTLISLLSGSMYGSPILSMHQLVESNLDVKVAAMLKSVLQVSDSKNKDLITMLSRAESLPHIDFGYITDQLIKEKNFATFTLEALMLMRPNIKKSFSSFTYLTIHTCFGMKKNDYSSPPLYNWILTIVECGYFVKFEKLHFNQLAIKFSVDVETNPYTINFRQFWPVMLLLFLGLATSAAGLLCEFLCFWLNNYLIVYKPIIKRKMKMI